MNIAGRVAIVFLVVSAGCQHNSPYQGVAKYFLVDSTVEDASMSWDIYGIDDPGQVEKVGEWAQTHIDPARGKFRRGPLLLSSWHHELLGFDEHGREVCAVDLGDPGVISDSDRVILLELFRKHGKRVDAVPGRKPPKQHVPLYTLIKIEETSPATVDQAGSDPAGKAEQDDGR